MEMNVRFSLKTICIFIFVVIKYDEVVKLTEFEKNHTENEEQEINNFSKKFKKYFRVGAIFGIMYGLTFGWMWGKKGMIFGPLIGLGVGTILAILFTIDKRHKIDRDNFL